MIKRLISIFGLMLGILTAFYLVLLFARDGLNPWSRFYLNPILLVAMFFFSVVGSGQFFLIYKIYVRKESIRMRLPVLVSRLINAALFFVVCLLGLLFILIVARPF